MPVLSDANALLEIAAPLELRGSVTEVRGLALCVADLPAPVGATVRVTPKRNESAAGVEAEVIGFDHQHTLVMPLGSTAGIHPGDRVTLLDHAARARVGQCLLGRVLNATGKPIDEEGPLGETVVRPLHPKPVDPLERPVIEQPLATGIRAIDALTPLGRGQRMGVFAAAGVGKSTLLGAMARCTAADVSVIALVGERGREVREFIERTLGPEGLARSVVVCATGDEPALLRIRAAALATAVAEYFRDEGCDVLLLMDSVTRLCQAQRQVGLSAGEPPTTKGYPPSMFSMLPALLERSGRTRHGSITGLYSILVESDDMDEPVADACRGILDGHILLSRKLAEQGHFPAIDVTSSISRVADEVTTRQQGRRRAEVLKLVSAYQRVEDLLNIGAYASGSNPEFDLAIACKPAIDQLLQQGRNEGKGSADFQQTQAQLDALCQHIEQAKKQLGAGQQRKQAQGPQ